MKSLSLSQPHAIVMVGLPGSGKTFFAEKFAETFSAPYFNISDLLDHNIDKQVAVAIARNTIEQFIRTKHSIVIEGLSSSRAERTELSKFFRQRGYETLFVWVQTDNDTSKSRHVKAGGNEELYQARTKQFSPPHSKENPIVISGKHTYATQAKTVLRKLSAPRIEISTHSTPPTRSFQDVRRSR